MRSGGAYPNNIVDINLVRKKPHTTDVYLAVYRPKVVWMGQMSSSSPIAADYPLSAIQASNTTSGHLTNVTSGMTLWLGTAASKNDYGKLRVRASPTAGSSIAISETPCGLIKHRDFPNTCLTIVDERGIWPIHPNYNNSTSVWNVDFTPYTSQTAGCYGPVALLGPPAVIWIDPNTPTTNACFVGDRSFTFSPGTSITESSWNWPTVFLTALASPLGSSTNPRVVAFRDASPNGDYVRLFVKDSNGASHESWRPMFAFNGSNASPFRVQGLEITGGLRQEGYSARVAVYDDAPSANFVDGAQVVIFENSSYGTSASQSGGNYPFRENILMWGWIENESIDMNPFTSGVTFTVKTVDGMLRRTKAFDLFLESGSAASSWTMASDLNLNHAALVLTKYRSTIANVVDVNFDRRANKVQGGDLDIAFQSLPKGSIWEQLKQNFHDKGNLGLVYSDLQSSLYFSDDFQVTGNSPGVVANLLPEDIANISMEHDHTENNAQVRLFGFNTSNSRIAAAAPADPGGYFGNVLEFPRGLVCTNQNTLAIWAGNLRAQENNPHKRFVFRMSGNYKIDSVPQSHVFLDIPTASRPRGWVSNKVTPIGGTLSADRYDFVINETNVRYNSVAGFLDFEYVGEAAVDGTTGSAINFV